MTFGSRLLRVAETLLTAFLGHLLVFRFTLPESVLAHAIWMCMAKAPYRSLTIAPTIAPVRPQPSPLCLGRTQFLSVYWLLVYYYCLCVGGTTPWRGDQKCGACTQHMSDQIGFIISFNCTVQKETLVVQTVSLHHRVLFHQTNITHPRLSLPLFFLELSSQQQLCPYTVMPLWRGHQLQCVLAEMGNWWSGECSFVLDLQWTGANRNDRNDYSNSL